MVYLSSSNVIKNVKIYGVCLLRNRILGPNGIGPSVSGPPTSSQRIKSVVRLTIRGTVTYIITLIPLHYILRTEMSVYSVCRRSGSCSDSYA